MSVFTDQATVVNTPLPVDGSGVTQPVSAVSLPLPANAAQETGGHLASIDTKLTNPLPVTSVPVTSNISTITQVTSTGVNQTLLAANVNRKKAIAFFNSGIWFVKFGVGASATSFTYNVTSSNFTIEIPLWIGQIDVLCTTSGKVATVTELV